MNRKVLEKISIGTRTPDSYYPVAIIFNSTNSPSTICFGLYAKKNKQKKNKIEESV